MRRGLSSLVVAASFVVAMPSWAQEAAPSDQAASAQDGKKAKKPRASRNLITRDQIDKAVERGATSAYDVVQQVRRDWFRVRPDLTAGSGVQAYATNRPIIFMDMQQVGDDPELLRSIKPEQIKEIKFLSGPDATTLFGTGFPHGVIQVITQVTSQ